MGIVINHSENIFLLQTRSNSYAFGINDQGLVRHLYWGTPDQEWFLVRSISTFRNALAGEPEVLFRALRDSLMRSVRQKVEVLTA